MIISKLSPPSWNPIDRFGLLTRRIKFVPIGLLTLLAATLTCAQEPDSKPAVAKSEMLSLQILVLDPDGNPVEDAVVRPIDLMSVGHSVEWSKWNIERDGPIPELFSDENGKVEMPYPKFGKGKLEIAKLDFKVEHPGFVVYDGHIDVEELTAIVKLVPGFRIAVTALDARTNKKITADLYGVINGSDVGSAKWKMRDDGMLVSPVLGKEQTGLRVVKLTPGEPVLYSEWIDISLEDRSRVLQRNLKLSLGTRVDGRLDDSIQRPIRNGHVCAMIVRKTRSQRSDGGYNHWVWFDKTPIAENGSFVFESLPSDEVLQMIPICEGWVPKKPILESVKEFFSDGEFQLAQDRAIPQILRLEGELVRTILFMEPATSVRVTVVDQDGDPLPGADVNMWPNQLWFEGGSQVLGGSISMSEVLVALRNGERELPWKSPFMATTNADGIALIKNLPVNQIELVGASLDGFEMKSMKSDRIDRKYLVQTKPNATAEVTVHMQPEGTQVLDQNAYAGDKIAELELSFQSAAEYLLRLWQSFF